MRSGVSQYASCIPTCVPLTCTFGPDGFHIPICVDKSLRRWLVHVHRTYPDMRAPDLHFTACLSVGSPGFASGRERLSAMATRGRPPRLDVDFVKAAMQLSEDYAHELGYVPRLFAQTSLPYVDPGNIPAWQRVNGNLTLSIQPGPPERALDGSFKPRGLPYGAIPRLLITWLSTEVVRTRQRELVLGNSIADFMRRIELGAPTGGRNGNLTRFRDQINRLFRSSITVSYDGEPDQDWFESSRIADTARLWWSTASNSNPEQQELLKSYVVISHRFFDEVTRHPVPVNMDALSMLRSSARKLDIYTWLTYRMCYLRYETTVPWEALRWQFGSDVGSTPAQLRSFRQKFERALADVLIIYRDAASNVESTSAGLKLRPTRPHVKATKLRQESLS